MFYCLFHLYLNILGEVSNPCLNNKEFVMIFSLLFSDRMWLFLDTAGLLDVGDTQTGGWSDSGVIGTASCTRICMPTLCHVRHTADALCERWAHT